MALEVEMKAHISDRETVGERLEAVGFQPVGVVDKDDRYFRSENGTEFRIRVEPTERACRVIVTHKRKAIRDGMEFNEEHEFELIGLEAFETFCQRIGAAQFAAKRKRGRVYRRDGLTAEVVEVEGLGSFLEIECVLEEVATESGKSDSDTAAQKVRSAFRSAGIEAAAIEPRTYLDMLGKR